MSSELPKILLKTRERVVVDDPSKRLHRLGRDAKSFWRLVFRKDRTARIARLHHDRYENNEAVVEILKTSGPHTPEPGRLQGYVHSSMTVSIPGARLGPIIAMI